MEGKNGSIGNIDEKKKGKTGGMEEGKKVCLYLIIPPSHDT